MTVPQRDAQAAFPLGTRVKLKVAAVAFGLVCGWTSKGKVIYESGNDIRSAMPEELDVKP